MASFREIRADYERETIVVYQAHIIREYVDDWLVGIADYTPLTKKIRRLCDEGHYDRAKKLLPAERVYPVDAEVARNLGMLF